MFYFTRLLCTAGEVMQHAAKLLRLVQRQSWGHYRVSLSCNVLRNSCAGAAAVLGIPEGFPRLQGTWERADTGTVLVWGLNRQVQRPGDRLPVQPGRDHQAHLQPGPPVAQLRGLRRQQLVSTRQPGLATAIEQGISGACAPVVGHVLLVAA